MNDDFLSLNFKKLEISPKCARKISHIQSCFEKFSSYLLKMCRNNKESEQAIIRLQEACVWFCRSIAKAGAYDLHRKKNPEEVERKVEVKEEIIEEEGDDIGNREPIIKEPTVIFKKKRQYIKK